MKAPRTPAQEVMDAARGDPEGKQRQEAWESFNADRDAAYFQPWGPPLPPGPFALMMRPYRMPTFDMKAITPWTPMSFVGTPADPGPESN